MHISFVVSIRKLSSADNTAPGHTNEATPAFCEEVRHSRRDDVISERHIHFSYATLYPDRAYVTSSLHTTG